MTAQSKRLKADEKQTYGPRANSRIPISKTKATRKQNSAKTVGKKKKTKLELSVKKNDQNACLEKIAVLFFWQKLGRHCSFHSKENFVRSPIETRIWIVNCFRYTVVHLSLLLLPLISGQTFGFIHLNLLGKLPKHRASH